MATTIPSSPGPGPDRRGPRRRTRAILTRLLAVLAALIAATAVAELGARIFFPNARDHALPRKLVVVDDSLGWKLARSVEVSHATSHFRVTYRTNSFGFRDREPDGARDGRAARLLLYGDSQVFGWGVPAEDRFSERVEDRLSIDVWNLAVPGYGLDQQLLAYERDAEGFRADAVAFFLSPATLQRISFDYLFGIPKPHFRLDGAALRLAPPSRRPGRYLLYRLPDWMYLPYFLDQTLARLELRWGVGKVAASEAGAPDLLLREVLRRADRRASSRRQKMLVLSALDAPAEARLRDLCAALGVELVSVRVPEGRADLVFGKNDLHWTVRANEIVAEQLIPQLAASLHSGDPRRERAAG